MVATAELVKAESRGTLINRMATKYGVDAGKMLTTLKATAFHSKQEVSNEQMMALMVVADQYNLNPWTKEIYAFPDSSKGGIVPVVGIDGWARIINENPNFAGMNFTYGPADEKKHKGAPAWIECTMYRKDRPEHPCTVRESLVECYRDTPAWQSHPGRMLRHKSMIQCARVAFGFVGVYDPDEAERIIEGSATRVAAAEGTIKDINEEISGKKSIVQETAPLFSYAQVRAALENALDGPAEAFALAQEMIPGAPVEFQPELEAIAEKIAHQRADMKAAEQE